MRTLRTGRALTGFAIVSATWAACTPTATAPDAIPLTVDDSPPAHTVPATPAGQELWPTGAPAWAHTCLGIPSTDRNCPDEWKAVR